MQGLGYAWVMMPALKRLYSEDPVAMKKALKTSWLYEYNATMSHLIVGADMALEEEVGIEDEMAITGLKTGLMGPFRVGDTILSRFIVRLFSIAYLHGAASQVVGLLIPLIAGAVVLWVRYKFTWIGYHQEKNCDRICG